MHCDDSGGDGVGVPHTVDLFYIPPLHVFTGKWRFMKSKKHLMKPKMAIISLLEGNFALSTSENATSVEAEAFLDEFDKGMLNLQKFNLQVVCTTA